MSPKLRGSFLCLWVIILLVLGAPAASLAQDNGDSQGSRSFIVVTWQKAVDWTIKTWNKAVAWVIEQSTQIARALTFWRENNQAVVAETASAPQVLGEEKVFSSGSPVAPTPTSSLENNQISIINNQENTNNQSLPPDPSPVIPEPDTLLIPETVVVPVPDHPPTPSLVKEGEPITTPEIIVEPEKAEEKPAKQSSSYFIPILARDTLAPISAISALATSTSSSFTVSWTGQDTDITGSPSVASYDIQYQVDSGAWTDWLSRTTLLSDLFTGAQDEKNYGFRSRSRDRYSNLETYPDSADATTYANLSIPVTPAVTSHTNGGTVMSTTADEDTSSGSTVQVTLSGTGEASNVLTITLSETSTTATTTVSLLGTWSKQFTLAEGANNFTLQTQESDGDNSLAASFVLNLEMVPTREVVINELAWMGTAASTGDEWIELYNASSTAIDLSSWVLASSDGTPSVTISGSCANTTIAAKSYYLLEKTDDNTVKNITADCVYGGTQILGDGGELLTLRDSTSKLIDKVGSSTVAWFAGDNTSKATMERKDPTTSGTVSSNWANNDGTLVNGKASDNFTALTATAKSLNSVNTTIPRVVTDLQMQFVYTTTTSLRLYWTTPKTANLATTTPATYDIRYLASASCPITESNWASATAATGEPTPSATPGTAATSTVSGLASNTSYCFGIKTNNGSNDSAISNSYLATTEDGNYTTLAGYPISGIIASSTSPYIITADITIPASGSFSLVIQPGAVVKMSGVRNIILSANTTLTIGSASDAINAAVVTSKDDNSFSTPASGSDGTPGAGDWNRITMSSGSISMNNSIIRYGGNAAGMVQMTGGSTSITRSILEWSNNYAITLGNDATALTLSNSTIQNNNEGIGISTSANATISGSTFTGNHRGIAIGTTADETNLSISGNNFYANNRVFGATVFAGIHYSDTTGTLTAENNWWGSASGPTTASPDSDDTRDAAMADTTAVIDYTPYATSVFTVLPSNL